MAGPDEAAVAKSQAMEGRSGASDRAAIDLPEGRAERSGMIAQLSRKVRAGMPVPVLLMHATLKFAETFAGAAIRDDCIAVAKSQAMEGRSGASDRAAINLPEGGAKQRSGMIAGLSRKLRAGMPVLVLVMRSTLKFAGACRSGNQG